MSLKYSLLFFLLCLFSSTVLVAADECEAYCGLSCSSSQTCTVDSCCPYCSSCTCRCRLSNGAIAGIVIACVIITIICIVACVWRRRYYQRNVPAAVIVTQQYPGQPAGTYVVQQNGSYPATVMYGQPGQQVQYAQPVYAQPPPNTNYATPQPYQGQAYGGQPAYGQPAYGQPQPVPQ